MTDIELQNMRVEVALLRQDLKKEWGEELFNELDREAANACK